MAELITMYPGQVNSPAAELAENINEIVTTIKLVDSSILPPAPNIAVIGVGENAETILYGDKNDTTNELLEITRGFQGKARAWTTGIKIRRLFTAYDWDSSRENIEDINIDINLHKADNQRHFTTLEKSKLEGIQEGAQVNTVASVAGKTGDVELDKEDVGLNNVQNYPVATQQEAEEGISDEVYITALKARQAISAFPSIANLDKAPNFFESTTSGVWNKPEGIKQVYIEMWGAGGGGGGGRRIASGSGRYGAEGGAGGGFVAFLFNADDLTNSVQYVIGAGGLGGQNGSSAGQIGGDTVFDTVGHRISAKGGEGGRTATETPYQYKGIGGKASPGLITENGADCSDTSNGVVKDGNNTLLSGPSGGSGGGTRSPGGNQEYFAGGKGGISTMSGLTPSTANANGKAPINNRSCGSGGGGGTTSSTNARDGGHGGIASGGGGGGLLVAASGNDTKGGNGGDGIIRIWCW